MNPESVSMSSGPTSAIAQAMDSMRRGNAQAALLLLRPWAVGAAFDVQATRVLSVVLMQQRSWDEAIEHLQRLVAVEPSDVSSWVNLANVQVAVGNLGGALASLQCAQALAPEEPAVQFNLGNLLQQRGDFEAAIACFARAAELVPERPDPLCNQAVSLNALRRHAEALRLLDVVVAKFPALGTAWNIRGAALDGLGNLEQAVASYVRAIELDSGQVDAYCNSAGALLKLGRIKEAGEYARQAIDRFGETGLTLRTMAAVFVASKQDEHAEPLIRRAAELVPDDPVIMGLRFTQSMKACDWRVTNELLPAVLSSWSRSDVEIASPWNLLACSVDGPTVRSRTEISSRRMFGHFDRALVSERSLPQAVERPQRLRIGYFSADLRDHPVGILMAGALERHDKSRFETLAFCSASPSQQADTVLRKRLQASFDHFESVSDWSDERLAEHARSLGLHIAIDLSGFTSGGRLGAFARGMAPVQMHYLGYPGTLGLPKVIDYLVADPVLVPPHLRELYSEKIIQLPESYQANDRMREIAGDVPDRAALGLPADGFVFCCFNNHYKITQEVFGLWMSLLQQRPGSVLWLQGGRPLSSNQLRASAAAFGVDPSRLVFATFASQEAHLARHIRADLFLDTWPYNAHTTASDALWAGLPVLSCAGQTFSSRVGASLLTACGLPELITESPQDYLNLALELSSHPGKLGQLRDRLARTRLQVPLFDTERFTSHLEIAYDMAWGRHSEGLSPEHFAVPTLPSALSKAEGSSSV